MKTLVRVMTWIRCIAATAMMFIGFGMANAVVDVDHPDGAPMIYLLWGGLVFLAGVAVGFGEVMRHAEG